MENLSIEERVARLEGKLGWGPSINVDLKPKLGQLSLLFLLLGLAASWFGLGIPNHYYQIVLGILVTVLAYHKQWLIKAKDASVYPMYFLNAACLSLLFKLFIGSGNRFPLSWIMYPTLSKTAENSSKWAPNIVGGLELQWQPSAIASWSIDLTIVQTFLLLLTIIAAYVEFQPFASLIAVILVLFSIPALVSFNWTWVFPAILLIAVALYLQSPDANIE